MSAGRRRWLCSFEDWPPFLTTLLQPCAIGQASAFLGLGIRVSYNTEHDEGGYTITVSFLSLGCGRT